MPSNSAGSNNGSPSAGGGRAKPLLSTGEIAGIATGIVILLIVVGCLSAYSRRRRRAALVSLAPVFQVELRIGPGSLLPVAGGKIRKDSTGCVESCSSLASNSQAAEIRQALLRDRILTELGAMNNVGSGVLPAIEGDRYTSLKEARQQIQAQQTRITDWRISCSPRKKFDEPLRRKLLAELGVTSSMVPRPKVGGGLYIGFSRH
ncbi:hypothetical protein B0H14DRAFT_2579901 [Mycena olivaceomarginata]|nr:hypothetical protein B0H14DRAFT_2579901 [Mycena olivaceomarginata]